MKFHGRQEIGSSLELSQVGLKTEIGLGEIRPPDWEDKKRSSILVSM